MTATIYTIDAANMFIGTQDPGIGKALLIRSVKLPNWAENFVDYKPSGSRVAMKLHFNIEAPECTFKFDGYDPEMSSIFGQRKRRTFTVRHKLTDQAAEEDAELVSIMRGRLGKMEKDEFSRGDLHGVDYMISAINHYEEYFQGQEKIYWDAFTFQYRIDGVDQNAGENAILGII